MNRAALAIFLSLNLATSAVAQNLDVYAGRLLDPASGVTSPDRRVRIVGGRIAAITPWREGDGPSLDWSRYTVLPGLIDLHTHLADGYGQSSEPLKHTLGKEGEVGGLAPGNWGDLVAVDGDPLADVSRLEPVAGVIKAGKPVRAD